MPEANTSCRWGIIGAANIARKVVQGMHIASNAIPAAIASRSLERAGAFAKETEIAQAYGSYAELLADPEIDAVYVPIPTALRKQVLVDAAAAGKHVLSEKPVAPNAKVAEEVITACDKAGVQFMDGVMFMHHKRYHRILERLPEIGSEPTSVNSTFTFLGDDAFLATNIRTSQDTEPLGCVGDIAWYNVRISLAAMGCMPTVVRARQHELHGGVPIHVTGELEFPGEKGPRICPFQCSYRHPLREWAEIIGDRGSIWIHDFVHGDATEAAFEIHTDTVLKELDTIVDRGVERIAVDDCVQEAEMIQTFSRIALGEDPLDPQWPRWALDTQRVIDAIMESGRRDGGDISL